MPYQMWINGEHTSGTSGSIIEVHNPATEEIIDTAPAANAADVDKAVSAAQAGKAAWKRLPAGQKAEMLHEVAQKLTERTGEIARLLTLEGGKPLISEDRSRVSAVLGGCHSCRRQFLAQSSSLDSLCLPRTS